jgi:hypothetical protein
MIHDIFYKRSSYPVKEEIILVKNNHCKVKCFLQRFGEAASLRSLGNQIETCKHEVQEGILGLGLLATRFKGMQFEKMHSACLYLCTT